MNGRLNAALAALPARQLNMLCIGVVAIAIMLAWTVGLRGPLAAWRQARTTLTTLEATAATTAAMRTNAMPASATVAPAAPSVVPAPLALVGAISRSARLAGVDVSSAAQGPDRTVAGLPQQVIDITATGGYAAIHAWLDDVERTQPAVGIVQLGLQAGDTGRGREVTVQLAIYGASPSP